MTEHDIAIIWPEAEYIKHDCDLGEHPEATGERYLVWLEENKAELFKIYRKRLDAGDKESLETGWTTWCKIVFNRYDTNASIAAAANAVAALMKEFEG